MTRLTNRSVEARVKGNLRYFEISDVQHTNYPSATLCSCVAMDLDWVVRDSVESPRQHTQSRLRGVLREIG
jgi:hypothetical protein